MTEEQPTDEELVEALRQAPEGDLRAFDTLVRRHQEKVTANARYMSGSTEDARDLAQEVFVKAFFGLARFEGRAKFKTWLQRIKVNHCLNFLKKRRGETFIDVDEPWVEAHDGMHVDPEAERRLDAVADRAEIARVLDSLSDSLRIPLIMRDMDGLAYQEIAEELGIGLSAVKMRIKRGREEFRLRFQAPGASDRSTPAVAVSDA